MKPQKDFRALGCAECANGVDLGFEFTMAFQPIVDTRSQVVFAQEALVRGPDGQSAAKVFQHVDDSNRYRFDQSCRVKAIRLAAQLGIDTFISINFMPNAVYRPELCIRTTLEAAEAYDFPVERIVFEITEGEKVDDIGHLKDIVEHYKQRGFKTAIDDFGAGYSGLNLLAEMQTDLIKLDMALIRGIDASKQRQAIVKGILQVAGDLGIDVIAEGIETPEELHTLQSFGVFLFQGYLFARPAFESTAKVTWPPALDR